MYDMNIILSTDPLLKLYTYTTKTAYSGTPLFLLLSTFVLSSGYSRYSSVLALFPGFAQLSVTWEFGRVRSRRPAWNLNFLTSVTLG